MTATTANLNPTTMAANLAPVFHNDQEAGLLADKQIVYDPAFLAAFELQTGQLEASRQDHKDLKAQICAVEMFRHLALNFAAKEVTRYALNAVLVVPVIKDGQPNGVLYVATNGHILGFGHDPAGSANMPFLLTMPPHVLKAIKPFTKNGDTPPIDIENGRITCVDGIVEAIYNSGDKV